MCCDSDPELPGVGVRMPLLCEELMFRDANGLLAVAQLDEDVGRSQPQL